MRAAKAGKHTTVEKLLKRGANPNVSELDSVSTHKIHITMMTAGLLLQLRWTPLMWASHRGHAETVKVLLKHGGNPNEAAPVCRIVHWCNHRYVHWCNHRYVHWCNHRYVHWCNHRYVHLFSLPCVEWIHLSNVGQSQRKP